MPEFFTMRNYLHWYMDNVAAALYLSNVLQMFYSQVTEKRKTETRLKCYNLTWVALHWPKVILKNGCIRKECQQELSFKHLQEQHKQSLLIWLLPSSMYSKHFFTGVDFVGVDLIILPCIGIQWSKNSNCASTSGDEDCSFTGLRSDAFCWCCLNY